MVLSKNDRIAKLSTLAEMEGFDTVDDMIAATVCDSVSPAICIAEGRDYTVEMEPDQDQGWCEACDRNCAVSALVLTGVI